MARSRSRNKSHGMQRFAPPIDPTILEREWNAMFGMMRTVATSLDENPNTAKRHLGHGDGFAIEAQCRDSRREYHPLTVTTVARDKLGRKSPRSTPSSYTI